MLDDTDRAVLGWAAEISGIPDPSLFPLIPTSEGPHVHLYLFDVEDLPPLRGNGRASLQFTARYLVTVSAPDAEDSHRIFRELLFAATENSSFSKSWTKVTIARMIPIVKSSSPSISAR